MDSGLAGKSPRPGMTEPRFVDGLAHMIGFIESVYWSTPPGPGWTKFNSRRRTRKMHEWPRTSGRQRAGKADPQSADRSARVVESRNLLHTERDRSGLISGDRADVPWRVPRSSSWRLSAF